MTTSDRHPEPAAEARTELAADVADDRHPETAVEARTELAADVADMATTNSEREATPPRRLGVSDRIRAREPRDWSDSVKVHDQALLDRFGRFLDGYTDRVDIWRYPIAGLQGRRCFYGGRSVLRTFAPVVHRGIDCDVRASAQACARFDHYRVACMNHASALGDRTDAELMEAIDSDPQLKSCYPDPRLPNGHGWCATGVVASDRAISRTRATCPAVGATATTRKNGSRSKGSPHATGRSLRRRGSARHAASVGAGHRRRDASTSTACPRKRTVL